MTSNRRGRWDSSLYAWLEMPTVGGCEGRGGTRREASSWCPGLRLADDQWAEELFTACVQAGFYGEQSSSIRAPT